MPRDTKPQKDLWRDLLIVGWSVAMTLCSRAVFDVMAEWLRF